MRWVLKSTWIDQDGLRRRALTLQVIFSSVPGRPRRWPLISILSGPPKLPRKTHGRPTGVLGGLRGQIQVPRVPDRHDQNMLLTIVFWVRGARKVELQEFALDLKSSKLCGRVYKSCVLAACKYQEPPTKPTSSLQFPHHTDEFL